MSAQPKVGVGIPFGDASLDLLSYASQGNAVLGIRDSGKSYTATMLAEQIFSAGIPFVAFDPVGVWRFLRVPGRGKGYPVVVAGGADGDLPITVNSAPEIVRAAMANGVSLVIDLFDINLSKADWKRIVMSCVRVLLHENAQHGLRHIYLEEAAEFCPQKVGPDQGAVYAEIEKLARMGGNSRLGYTLINQRAEEVNKAVLELCDNLFLHRQKGKNSLTSLSKWLDIGNVREHKRIIESLSTLPTGECWAWLAGADDAVRVKVPPKNSFHPDRRVMRGEQDGKPKAAVDVKSFVSVMRESLGKIEEEAKENDVAALKKRIKQLEAGQGSTAPELDVEAEIRSAVSRATNALNAAWEEKARQWLHKMRDAEQKFRDALEAFAFNQPWTVAEDMFHVNPKPRANPVRTSAVVEMKRSMNGQACTLPEGEKKILQAAAQYPEGATREQLSILTGYKRSTRDAYLQRLGTRAYVAFTNGSVTATPSGVDALGSDYEPLPTGDELQAYWMNRLPEGEAKILLKLLGAYPGGLDRETLSERTDFKRSTRDAYIQRLAGKKLVQVRGGEVFASEHLF